MAKASLKTKINYQNTPKKNQQKQGFSLGLQLFLNPSFSLFSELPFSFKEIKIIIFYCLSINFYYF
ncbi:MAG: hypothetical protein EAZ58_11725 [Flavobacterium sp.]|nr:MAG: hypothetical protein EAZ58_11725 [Flavobacterium sp.]